MGGQLVARTVETDCLHVLGQWQTKTPKRPSRYPDGTQRAGAVGGRLVRVDAPCSERPGHDKPQPWNDGQPTEHRTADGRCWL